MASKLRGRSKVVGTEMSERAPALVPAVRNLAGLKIPGKNAAQTVDDANKCKSGDNDACTRIGQSVVDVSGLNVKN